MEYERIIQIIDIIDKSSLSKFNYKREDFEINIEKSSNNCNKTNNLEKSHDNETIYNNTNIDNQDENIKYVKSPLVGTYYSSPSPDEKPYIQIGDKITKGQIIGIIEAMKVMNEVTSDCDGIVEDILIRNNDTVEYGQSLIKITIS
ncbi:MAG: acetyl-CoA carboxylase biotin carboxyl carrier protein [Peptostreptococcaceae bacterium]